MDDDPAGEPLDPALRERIESDPVAGLLGAEFRTLRRGRAEVALDVEERHCNVNGALHGGITFALADVAAGAVAAGYGGTGVSVESNISYLDGVEPGEAVVATGRQHHESGQFREIRVSVDTESGTPVASVRIRGYKFE